MHAFAEAAENLRLVGRLACGSPFFHDSFASADWAADTSARASQSLQSLSPLTLTDATGGPFATPLKRGGRTVPTTPGSFEPINDLNWGGRMLAVQRPPFENTLDRFGHIQPRPVQRGV
jgi:hypothetical protein